MRRTLLVALVVALATAAAAVAGRGDPQKRIVPADQARAKAMLLRAGDLTGFRARPSSSSNGDFYCEALDESDLTLTGEAESPTFEAGAVFVSSLSQVYETAADSNVSWKRGTNGAGEKCARQQFVEAFRTQGLDVRSFRKMSFPRLAEKSVAYRFVVAGQGLRVYLDAVVLKRGRAQAAVLFGSALTPFPKDLEVRLARTVERRMRTAIRGSP